VNTFNYAENRPINAIDLHGLQAIDVHSDIRIAEKLAQKDGSNVVENFKAIRGHKGSLALPSGSTSGAFAKGEIADGNAHGNFSLEGSFMEGEAYNNSGLTALSIGAEGATFSAKGDVQLGSDLLSIVFGGEGSLLSAESNLDAGMFLGEGDKIGPLFDGNIGAFSAEGEISGGMTILGIKFTGTVGGSVGSAHAGLTIGMTYDKKTSNVTIEGMEHLGFGFGQKAGGKVEIPTFGIFQQDDK
jgi:hypothetical protein